MSNIPYSRRSVMSLLLVLLAALMLLSVSPASASIPSTGYFYILLQPTGAACVDGGGGTFHVHVDTFPRTAYVPSNNTITGTFTNAVGLTTLVATIGAQGAP